MSWIVPFFLAVFVLPILFGAWAWFEVIGRMQEEAYKLGRRTLLLRSLLITFSAAFLVGASLLADPERSVRLISTESIQVWSYLPVAVPWVGFAALGVAARLGRATDPRRVHAERERAKTRLTEQRDATETLMASLAQELRTSLALVRAAVPAGGQVPSAMHSKLRPATPPPDLLLTQLEHVERVVQEMAPVSCPAEGSVPTSVTQVVRDVMSARREWLQARDVEFLFVPEVDSVVMPRKDLELLIVPLIEQAVRSAPHGDGVVRLATEHRRDGSTYLTVTDNGPGVSEDQREAAFGLHGHAVDRLGAPLELAGPQLALVRRMARAHGGDAWVEDGREGGCAWVVCVPGTPTEPVSRPAR